MSISQFRKTAVALIAAGAMLVGGNSYAEDKAKPFTVTVPGTKVGIKMVPIPGGVFKMGSPASEENRKDDEGPQVEVKIEPFWIGSHEITWDDYIAYADQYELLKNAGASTVDPTKKEKYADAVSFPTPIYPQDAVPIYNAMGWGRQEGGGRYPVADLTQLNAKQYCKWLTKKTGIFYRLPTEAEWEYAARAGTTTPYFFGKDKDKLGDYAWYYDNSEFDDPDKGHPDTGTAYRKVGLKKPNPWGLYDIYGNVAEWTMDQHAADHYKKLGSKPVTWQQALNWPKTVYPRVARGGHYDADPEQCRSASRLASEKDWAEQDPQIPRSIWWLTDAFHVGFRIVRPVNPPKKEDWNKYWQADTELHLEVMGVKKQIRAEVKPAKAK